MDLKEHLCYEIMNNVLFYSLDVCNLSQTISKHLTHKSLCDIYTQITLAKIGK